METELKKAWERVKHIAQLGFSECSEHGDLFDSDLKRIEKKLGERK